MADLPNLDTATIGFIGYWNALDHGVADIDPTDVLSYGQIQTFQQFDNGVEGTVRHSFDVKNRDFNFRVKDDGWFIVWIDRTNNYATNTGNPPDNYADLVHDWTRERNPSALPVTTFSVEINQLQQRLSNAGSITFAHDDVGYYNYEFDTASRIGLASWEEAGGFGGSSTRAGIAFAAGTTRFYHVAFGACEASGQEGRATFAGVTLVNADANRAGIVDVLADGLMPNAGEYVDGVVFADRSFAKEGHLTIYTP